VVTDLSLWQGPLAGGLPTVITGTNLGNGSDITSVFLGTVRATIVSQSGAEVSVVPGAALSPGPSAVMVVSISYGNAVRSGYQYNPGTLKEFSNSGF
jgi:hypothetical protein